MNVILLKCGLKNISKPTMVNTEFESLLYSYMFPNLLITRCAAQEPTDHRPSGHSECKLRGKYKRYPAIAERVQTWLLEVGCFRTYSCKRKI